MPSDWYDGFFEGAWLDRLALPIPHERTLHEVSFVEERLELRPGQDVLDLACGHGRIALELARRGYRVTGLDLSRRSLALAREAAAREGLDVEWVHGDMRELPHGRTFDAVLSVFTAFGYFDEEEENRRVVDAVARALRPGGAFFVDVVNLLGLAGRYRPVWWEELEDGTLFLEQRRFDVLRGRNVVHWTLVAADGRRSELAHSLRTYAPHELVGMLERAGLGVVGTWGDWEGGELTHESWRLMVCARRAADDGAA